MFPVKQLLFFLRCNRDMLGTESIVSIPGCYWESAERRMAIGT